MSPVCTNQTFAHELGHNMGCAHDRSNAGASAYSYSYGWRWTGNGGTVWRSVMAYAPGNRIQYFSNPDVNYDGVPTGTATDDNARTIRNTANTVANFRQRVVVTGPSLVVSPDPINVIIVEGTNGSAVVKVGNAGPGSLSYSVSEDAAWAMIAPLNGTATASTPYNDHTLSINGASLAAGQYNASLTVTAPDAASNPVVVVPVSLIVIGRPPNDDFANAEVIPGPSGTVSGYSLNATRETGESQYIAGYAGAKSVWYRWVAPSSSPVEFTTVGSDFDTLLGAYTGNLGSLVLVAHNDDLNGGTRQSRILFTPVTGTTYNILVDGWNGDSGQVKLNWDNGSTVDDWSVY